MTVTQLSEGLSNKVFSSEEVTKAYLDHIRKKDKKIQAFLTLDEDGAIKKAREVDRRRIDGENLSKLAGIPMGVKDNICTKGMLTTCGSQYLKNFRPSYNATVIEKLNQEDVILLGKLNMDELGVGATSENSAFQTTRNPVHTDYVAGGSSGGSAAAVASQQVPFALGSDTGGSIRQPASFCGVVGLKPTYGMVSRYGLVAYGSTLDQIGPITKSVDDAEFLLDYMVGKDDKDSTSGFEANTYLKKETSFKQIKDIKIGICRELLTNQVEDEVRKSVLEAAEVYESLGAQVVEVSLSSLEYALSTYEVISSAEGSSNFARLDGVRYGFRAEDYRSIDELYDKSRSQGLGKSVKKKILMGTHLLSSGNYEKYYKKALQARKMIIQEFIDLFQQFHAILGPVSPTTAFKLGDKDSNPQKIYQGDFYTVPANLAGLPAISVPYGKGINGLPIGIQLIGSHFGEQELLQIAKVLEREAK